MESADSFRFNWAMLINHTTHRQNIRSFVKGIGSLTLVLLCGTIGFSLIEGWSWLDSLDKTINTISTVGGTRHYPNSMAGQLFNVALIFLGVGVMAFYLTRLAEFIFQRSLSNVIAKKKMLKSISIMKKHNIICGYGRTGSQVAAELKATGTPFVVIEKDEELLKRLTEQDIPHIAGDATEDATLHQANIDNADALVAVLNSDADNLYLCLTASGINHDLRIIVRTHDPDNAHKFRKAGAKRVVSPISSGATQITQLLTRPSVIDLIELVSQEKNIALEVCEYPIENDHEMNGKTLSEARVRQKLGCMVIAIKHSDGQTAFDPGPDTRLNTGDILVTLHSPENK